MIKAAVNRHQTGQPMLGLVCGSSWPFPNYSDTAASPVTKSCRQILVNERELYYSLLTSAVLTTAVILADLWP